MSSLPFVVELSFYRHIDSPTMMPIQHFPSPPFSPTPPLPPSPHCHPGSVHRYQQDVTLPPSYSPPATDDSHAHCSKESYASLRLLSMFLILAILDVIILIVVITLMQYVQGSGEMTRNEMADLKLFIDSTIKADVCGNRKET